MAANRRADLEGTFSAPGQSDTVRLRGNFNLSLFDYSGTPIFDAALQRSPDGGANWRNVPTKDGAPSYTAFTEERGFEPANYYLYRVDCTAVTGGVLGYAINR